MVGKQRKTSAKSTPGRPKAKDAHDDAAGIYKDMLAEALPTQHDTERPLKKRKVGHHRDLSKTTNATPSNPVRPEKIESDEDEDDVEFEDVPTGNDRESKQTAYLSDSGDESDELDDDFVDQEINIDQENPFGDLNLTLNSVTVPRQTTTPRRKAVSGAEKSLRLEVHKVHILCLLSHVSRRNDWCNDLEVHRALKVLLDKKTIQFLNPPKTLSQFGRTDSLKRGLEMVSTMWRKKFTITARGLRRSLWADDPDNLEKYEPPNDGDSIYEKKDFLNAAEQLTGSRDIGSQLLCAVLRSAGVDARLVCSLQPLSYTAGGPPLPLPKQTKPRQKAATPEAKPAIDHSTPPSHLTNPRRRLGHPMAAGYLVPQTEAPQPRISKSKPSPILESAYPIYWVEVLDEAHQKWLPVEALVLDSIAKAQKFEPPAADHENNMMYVIAFEDDGSAKDVTRRYAKAYNAKTRKNRVESSNGGTRWWRKTMRRYTKLLPTDVDQIEETELAATEAREPMPKNIIDFKDHPTYALERHLKRNEVLVRTQEIGRVAGARDARVPGGKRMESVYRRADVKIAKSADAWYRLGRDVKFGEVPVKVVPKRAKADRPNEDDDEAGTNLYTIDQTEIYQPPPCVDGKVPKNSFGNLDLFVPSMVPMGGVYISHNEAVRAAKTLGIDFAPALVGFEFHGRHGTAVLKGVVVAAEFRPAMEATIASLNDDQVREAEEARADRALKMWKHYMVSLRIRRRVGEYEVEGEEAPTGDAGGDTEDDPEYRQESNQTEEDQEDSDYGGGGFLPE